MSNATNQPGRSKNGLFTVKARRPSAASLTVTIRLIRIVFLDDPERLIYSRLASYRWRSATPSSTWILKYLMTLWSG